MKKFGRSLYAVVGCCLLIGITSCSKSPSRSTDGARIDLALQFPAVAQQLNLIETVDLLIHAVDMDTIKQTLPVVEGGVETTLDVPPGPDRVFEMIAADSNGRTIYYGSDTVTITQGIDQTVHILMEPSVLLLKASPGYQEFTVGSSGSIDIYIFEVDSLFGAAFRLYYDPSRIRLDAATKGDFLGEQVIWFPNFEENYLAVGVSRRTPDTGPVGVSGSGVLATVDFTVLASGTIPIRIAVESETALINPRGEPVERFEELALDGATVVARGVE